MEHQTAWVEIREFGEAIGAIDFIGRDALTVIAFHGDTDGSLDGNVGNTERLASKLSPVSVKAGRWRPLEAQAAAVDRLKERLDAGPAPVDRVWVLHGYDVQRIAKRDLGTDVSLTTVYRRRRGMP